MAPFYETENSVRTALSKGHLTHRFRKMGRVRKIFIIVDSLKKYTDNVSPKL